MLRSAQQPIVPFGPSVLIKTKRRTPRWKAIMMNKIYLGLFDIRSFLEHNHIHYSESGKNIRHGWIGIKCLWCDDHSIHMGINPATMGINCWRCSTTGTILKLVMKILRVDFDTACSVIRDYSTPGTTAPAKTYSPVENETKDPDIDLLAKFSREMATFQRDFILSRRYDPDEVFEKYNLHFAGPVGNFARRIIIPITYKGRVVSFVGRAASPVPSSPPYKNCSEEDSLISPKNTLYDIDSCKGSSVLVVEGIMDKWRMGDGTVATFGIQTTDSQVLLLKKFRRVFILFDSEPQAQAQARKLAGKLSIYTDVVQLQIEHGDPDDLSQDDADHLRKQIFRRNF